MSEIPMLFNAVQVAKIMGVSKSQVYNLMNSGRLASVSIGRSRRVTNRQMHVGALKAETNRFAPHNKISSEFPIISSDKWWMK